jgi:hypothetical protein
METNVASESAPSSRFMERMASHMASNRKFLLRMSIMRFQELGVCLMNNPAQRKKRTTAEGEEYERRRTASTSSGRGAMPDEESRFSNSGDGMSDTIRCRARTLGSDVAITELEGLEGEQGPFSTAVLMVVFDSGYSNQERFVAYRFQKVRSRLSSSYLLGSFPNGFQDFQFSSTMEVASH